MLQVIICIWMQPTPHKKMFSVSPRKSGHLDTDTKLDQCKTQEGWRFVVQINCKMLSALHYGMKKHRFLRITNWVWQYHPPICDMCYWFTSLYFSGYRWKSLLNQGCFAEKLTTKQLYPLGKATRCSCKLWKHSEWWWESLHESKCDWILV